MKHSHRLLLGQVSDTDLRLLRVFRTVAGCGGLSAAALELNVGRSTISRHLKDLEVRLGATLCHRGRSGFALTPEGQQVHEATLRLFTAIDTFRTEVGEAKNTIGGPLRVSVFDKTVTNPDARIAEAFARLEAEAPLVEVEYSVEPTNLIENGVIEGEYHLGIIPMHRPSPSLAYLRLFGERVVLYCGVDHELFNGAASGADERTVRQYKFAALAFHSPNMEVSRRHGLRRSAEAHDQEAVATLILSGRYLGFLPDHYAAPFVDQGLMRAVNADVFQYQCDFAAITRRSPKPARKVELFLECLRVAHSGGARTTQQRPNATAAEPTSTASATL